MNAWKTISMNVIEEQWEEMDDNNKDKNGKLQYFITFFYYLR